MNLTCRFINLSYEIICCSKSKQLHEAGESSGKEVFGFRTPLKAAGSMAQKVEEEMRRLPTPLATSRTTPRTPSGQQSTTTPVKVPVYKAMYGANGELRARERKPFAPNKKKFF